MPFGTDLTGVARAIQLSIAPVFLLTAIAGMLAVMTNRLSRVVDRMRFLERQEEDFDSTTTAEWGALASRARLITRSIALCTVTALLICTTIAVMFAGTLLDVNVSIFVELAFIVAMVTFVVGLTLFLREIVVAISSLHTQPRRRYQARSTGAGRPPS